MNQPLRLYVDPAWRKQLNHIPLLYPFWGQVFSKNLPYTSRIFERYSFDTKYYTITDDILTSDAILLPYRYELIKEKCPEVLLDARARAGTYGKAIVIDAVGDKEHDIDIPQSIVLCYGGYRFKRKNNEIIIPPYAEDLLERYCGGNLQLRPKVKKPTVGFVGWASLSPTQALRTYLKESPMRIYSRFDTRYVADRKGVFFRMRALNVLRKSTEIATNFIVRSSYSGNSKTATGNPDTLRREFIENALASDLCVDLRGDANASTRLFEILSLGRVPLIVDTERNFPFSEELDYQAFSILVDFRNLEDLPHIVREAYDRLSEDEWLYMQRKARDAYQNWFRVDALTPHLIHRIRKLIKQQESKGI